MRLAESHGKILALFDGYDRLAGNITRLNLNGQAQHVRPPMLV